jgi:hypothetical protein
MDNRSARLYVAAFAVLMIMAATMSWFGPQRASAGGQRVEINRHVEESVGPLVGRGTSPRRVIFLKTHCNCEGDASDWAMVAVAPPEVPIIRREILRRANQAGRRDVRTVTFIKSDADQLGTAAGSRPEWWTPTALPGAEIVAVGGGLVYVFSEKMGTIYVMSRAG